MWPGTFGPYPASRPGRLTREMFVRGQARLQAGLADARARLAVLTGANGLLRASQQAYATGTSLAQAGLPGPAWARCRLVAVHARDQAPGHDLARLALRWEVIGPDGKPFPALDADITLTPDGQRTVTLALTGVYRPPPGIQGDEDDQATVRRVAEATIQVFLDRIAEVIGGPARAGERNGGITGQVGSWPPVDPAP